MRQPVVFRSIFFFALLLLTVQPHARPGAHMAAASDTSGAQVPYLNPDLPIDMRVDDLV
jgi:hypothetical protein